MWIVDCISVGHSITLLLHCGAQNRQNPRMKHLTTLAIFASLFLSLALAEDFKTIREVSSDQRTFLDQPFLLKGTIDVSGYYNYGYAEAERTHYAFEISDRLGSYCYAYMQRGENSENLRQQLIQAGRPLEGVFTVMIRSGRYKRDAGSQLLVELLFWAGQ